jgi:hypothetical protein
MEKIYVGENNKITLKCPRCARTKEIDVTPLLQKNGPLRAKYRFKCETCSCGLEDCPTCGETQCKGGNPIIFQIERRKFFRKTVDLSGNLSTREIRKHPVRIRDLSRSGIRVESKIKNLLTVGTICQIEFNLDDAKQTQIKKEFAVVKVEDNRIDGKFTSIQSFDQSDKAIGFYLMTK